MFNHARTLLLNKAASTVNMTLPGSELVPKEFKPIRFSNSVRVVREALFGTTPDEVMLNYRIGQLLNVVSTTELNEFIRMFDPRITYSNDMALSLFPQDNFTPVVAYKTGSGNLQIFGDPVSPDVTGKCIYRYMIEVGNNGITATAAGVSDRVNLVDRNPSTSIALPGTDYVANLSNVDTGDLFVIEGNLRPTWDMGQLVLILESMGEEHIVGLFTLRNDELHVTLRKMWEDSQQTVYRLSAAVMALVFRTEELRTAEGS